MKVTPSDYGLPIPLFPALNESGEAQKLVRPDRCLQSVLCISQRQTVLSHSSSLNQLGREIRQFGRNRLTEAVLRVDDGGVRKNIMPD